MNNNQLREHESVVKVGLSLYDYILMAPREILVIFEQNIAIMKTISCRSKRPCFDVSILKPRVKNLNLSYYAR